jgi:hypothetical protein
MLSQELLTLPQSPKPTPASVAAAAAAAIAACALQAHMLSQELLTLPQGPTPPNVASLAAQTHGKRCVLGPLLCVASSVDALAVLRAGSGFFQSSGEAAGGYAPSGGAKVRAQQGAAC